MDGDVVTLSNSIGEQNSGETSTLNSISPIEDQALDGRLVTIVTNEALWKNMGGAGYMDTF